jgi:hypothetical protein
MSSLEVLLAQPLPRAVTLALLHFLWQGTAAALALALALRLMSRSAPTRRYAAGCLTLAVMAAMPAVTTWQLMQSIAPIAGSWSGLEATLPKVGSAAVAAVAPVLPDSMALASLQPWVLLAWIVASRSRPCVWPPPTSSSGAFDGRRSPLRRRSPVGSASWSGVPGLTAAFRWR